ncbi:hypothetical protein K8I61_02295 [bacterium]|nr:hypothetical protein [bacterium]
MPESSDDNGRPDAAGMNIASGEGAATAIDPGAPGAAGQAAPGPDSWLLRQARMVRPWVALLVAAVLLLVLDRAMLSLESRPGLALRNEYQSTNALSYMLARMKRVDPSVAFLGASVLQGVTNTTPEETAPVLVEAMLREQGIQAHTFNTATMGANFGDQYAIARAALKSGADAIVLSTHYKLFSSHIAVGNPLRYRELAFHVRGDPSLGDLRKDYEIDATEWLRIRLRGNLENVWALYRLRSVFWNSVTGSMDSPFDQLQDAWARRIGVNLEGDVGRNVLRNLDPARRDRTNIWKEMIEFHHEREREIYEQVHLNRYNVYLRLLRRTIAQVHDAGVPILVYLTPINRALNDEQRYFTWQSFDNFREVVARAAKDEGARVVDLSHAIPPAHFTDLDHLTRRGHAMLAEALAPPIAELLAERKTP